MRGLLALLCCAPIAFAAEVIDGTNPPNPAKFAWDAATKTATLIVDLNEEITITGDDITLDGNQGAGRSITGTGAGTGILVPGVSGVTIRNCHVRDFSTNVRILNSTGCKAVGNRTSGGAKGIEVFGTAFPFANDNEVRDNVCSNHSAIGITLHVTSGNVVADNTSTNNGTGVGVVGPDNQLLNNEVHDNQSAGLFVSATSGGSILRGNRIHRNDRGISVQDPAAGLLIEGNDARENTIGINAPGSDHVIRKNTASSNTSYGINANTHARLLIEDNVANDNGSHGIALSGVSTSDTARRNVTNDNGGSGIWSSVPGSTFTGNTASRNQNGFLLAGGSMAENNTATDNTSAGYVVVGAGSTLRNNTASGNTTNGILMSNSTGTGNVLEGNLIEGSLEGVRPASGSRLEGNTLQNNGTAILMLGVQDCDIHRNTVTGSTTTGIALGSGSTGNSIHDNLFNNTANVAITASAPANTWNVPATSGPNIVDGPSIGGNFWGSPAGDGHSETCADSDGDGFCDEPFVIDANNIDQLPLVLNSAPACNPSGAGVYECNVDELVLGGTVSDNDGDVLSFEWRKDGDVVFAGTIDPPEGGDPVALPDHVIASLPVGIHVFELAVDDGKHDEVLCEVVVEVIDTIAPTLAPRVRPRILWPPFHRMRRVKVRANAADECTGTPELAVEITSNEGRNRCEPDWKVVSIDPATGIIRLKLRAERHGWRRPRIYTITITATDDAGNISIAEVTVRVPRFFCRWARIHRFFLWDNEDWGTEND